MTKWAASVTFRGFDQSRDAIEKVLGDGVYRIGMRVEPAKPKVKTLLLKSYVKYEIEFPTSP